jgi:hypothetical protein
MLCVSFVLPRYLTEFYGNLYQGNMKCEEHRTTDELASNSGIERYTCLPSIGAVENMFTSFQSQSIECVEYHVT